MVVGWATIQVELDWWEQEGTGEGGQDGPHIPCLYMANSSTGRDSSTLDCEYEIFESIKSQCFSTKPPFRRSRVCPWEDHICETQVFAWLDRWYSWRSLHSEILLQGLYQCCKTKKIVFNGIVLREPCPSIIGNSDLGDTVENRFLRFTDDKTSHFLHWISMWPSLS